MISAGTQGLGQQKLSDIAPVSRSARSRNTANLDTIDGNGGPAPQALRLPEWRIDRNQQLDVLVYSAKNLPEPHRSDPRSAARLWLWRSRDNLEVISGRLLARAFPNFPAWLSSDRGACR